MQKNKLPAIIIIVNNNNAHAILIITYQIIPN